MKNAKKIFSKVKLLFQNIRCFGIFIPVSNLILVFMSSYFPASWMEKLAEKKHDAIKKYLQKTLKQTFKKWENNDSDGEKIENAPIWFCWLQGEKDMPDVQKLCLESLRKFGDGHPVYVITLDNYSEYVQVPERIKKMFEEKRMKPAHFSDVLRMALLYNHGGIWVDSSICLTQNISKSFFSEPFYSIKAMVPGYYISRCRWVVGMLAGWKGNPVYGAVHDLFCDYLQKNQLFVDYFMMDYFIDILYQSNPRIKKMIDNVPFNNPDFYSIENMLSQEFDPVLFEKLTRETNIFKLNWRKYDKNLLIKDKSNYYNYLKSL